MNTGPGPRPFSSAGKVCETSKLAVQLPNTATPIAVPRTLSGRTSGIITHTTGPPVAANEAMKVPRQTSVMIAAGSPGWWGVASTESEIPSTSRLPTMPATPASRIGFRPTPPTSSRPPMPAPARQQHRLPAHPVDDPDRDHSHQHVDHADDEVRVDRA